MADITITLLANKKATIALQTSGYAIIAGENNATTISVKYPNSYSGKTAYVYMRNANGSYAVTQLGTLGTTAVEYTLPETMAVTGNTCLVFYAASGTGSSLVRSAWAPIIIPVTATGVDYVQVALASPDILADVIYKANQAITQVATYNAAEASRVSAEQNRVAAWASAHGLQEIAITDTDNDKSYCFELKIVGGKPKLYIDEI